MDAVANISVTVYPDSKRQIFEYFGRETLKILFESSGWNYKQFEEYNKEYGHSSRDAELVNMGFEVSYEEKKDEVYLYSREKDNHYVDSFLASIGACLKFDMNEPLKTIINKYWNENCNKELKNFYERYGFFADKAFVDYKLENIFSRDVLMNFKAELASKAENFEIKWTGFLWSYITYKHIIRDYVQYLKFKWGLKPRICIKKCIFCGSPFYPFFYGSGFVPYCGGFQQIFKYFPIEHSLEEISFCPNHFPATSYGTFFKSEVENDPTIKQQMNDLLKNLVDTLEFIPPKTFHKNLYYLKGLHKEKFAEAIKLISKMPPLKKEKPSEPNGYQDVFGSWFLALEAAGVLEGGIRKSGRGYICLAKDGHKCRSIGEKIVDDYLYAHDIPHEIEPFYPGERKFRADWKVGKYFIELWGLMGEEDYDKKIQIKKDILQQYQIPLIEITFSDLRILDEIFKELERNM